jgi:hypothetical protein
LHIIHTHTPGFCEEYSVKNVGAPLLDKYFEFLRWEKKISFLFGNFLTLVFCLFVFNSPAVATDTGFTPIQSSRHHHHHNNFVQAPHLLQAAATAAGTQPVSKCCDKIMGVRAVWWLDFGYCSTMRGYFFFSRGKSD